MQGFPKWFNTYQDIINVVDNHPELHTQQKVFMQLLIDEPDTVDKVVSWDTDIETGEMINVVTKPIPRPVPMWKRLGFASKDEIAVVMGK